MINWDLPHDDVYFLELPPGQVGLITHSPNQFNKLQCGYSITIGVPGELNLTGRQISEYRYLAGCYFFIFFSHNYMMVQ